MSVRETGRHNREGEFLTSQQQLIDQQNATTRFLEVGTGIAQAGARVQDSQTRQSELEFNKKRYKYDVPFRMSDTIFRGVETVTRGGMSFLK